VFCVLLAGAVLGPRLGFASQAEYLAAGAAGLPVFSAGGGPAALLGPTAGYLLCFPFAALAVGMIVARLGQSTWSYATAGLAGVASIYLLGASWYTVWSALILGRPVGLAVVLAQSVVPFIAPDLVKAGLMAAAAPSVRRRLRIW
jgi:biotin transport system substrate-specific component